MRPRADRGRHPRVSMKRRPNLITDSKGHRSMSEIKKAELVDAIANRVDGVTK